MYIGIRDHVTLLTNHDHGVRWCSVYGDAVRRW